MKPVGNAPDDFATWRVSVENRLRSLTGLVNKKNVTQPRAPFSSRYLGANTPVPNAADFVVDFDIDEDTDDYGFEYSAGIWTIIRSGNYQINATLHFSSNATGVRQVRLQKNGVDYKVISANGAATAGGISAILSKGLRLAAGDTIRIAAWQNSTAALDLAGGASRWTTADLAYTGA